MGRDKEVSEAKKGITDRGEDEERFGCGFCKPNCLQIFNSVRWLVFWFSVFNFIEGFIVNGVINIVIVALETRYELTSSRSGMIASANDFGAIIFLVLVGYFGENKHKPKLITAGVFLMAIGSFVFALPQLIGEKYEYTVSDGSTNSTENVCTEKTGSSAGDCTQDKTDTLSYEGYYALLILGNCLIGIGAVPMFTLGLTYIDENSKTRDSSFHISFTFCAAAIGVAIGYIAGGQTLAIFVDIDKVDPSTVPLTPYDPQWVGAWWICLLAGCGGFLLVAFPIMGFPKRISGYDELQKNKKSEVHNSSQKTIMKNTNFGRSIKDFPKSLWLLLKNPTFCFIILGGTVEIFIIGGLATFGAKLFQEFYNIQITDAGTYMGLITILGSGGGMLIGGYVVKRFNLKCRGIIRFSCGCIFICMFLGPAYMASCPSQPLAGITTNYPPDSKMTLMSDCNKDCGCTTQGYEPVCDKNKVVYFSPCHAGCKDVKTLNGSKVYLNCVCVNSNVNNYTQWDTETGDVTSGSCSENCGWFYGFCVFLFLMMLFTFATMSPTLNALLRCVPQQQRSLAVGIQLLFGRLLGTTPGPIFLGWIIDSSCSVWQDACGSTGSCWVYKKTDLGLKLMFWWIGTKLVGVILLFIASKVYIPPDDDESEENDKNIENQVRTNVVENGVDNPVFTVSENTSTSVEDEYKKNDFSTRL